MIRLVVFDMAGTTVRDDDAVSSSFADALHAAGVERSRDVFERYDDAVGGAGMTLSFGLAERLVASAG